ncbi:MAG: hypothetical protein MJ108_03080 [Saccharofermentans sp.]|nr:hypothetical protein [Saccharofermentans sp.]
MGKRKLIFIIISAILFSCLTCACHKDTDASNTDSYWYGCSSFCVPAVEGYSQNVNAYIYSDGFYYLAVYSQKIDAMDGPDDYYNLYKIDSEGKEISVVELPTECVGYSEQIILADMLYCIGFNNNEYVVDINSGEIVRSEPSSENASGFYKIDDGYVKLTEEKAICYALDGSEVGSVDISNISNLNNNKPFYYKDGKSYLVKTSFDKTVFYELDFQNSHIEEVLDTDMFNKANLMINGDIVFSDTGVYTVDFDSATLIPITEWSYVDIKPAYKSTLSETNLSYGDKRFGRVYTYNDYEVELIIFNNISADVYGKRTAIIVGGYDVSTSVPIKWAVYLFNTSQDEYRVYLDEYWEKFPYSSGEEAQSQFDALIKYFNEGNAPDIYFGSNFDYRYMYNSGLVADMLPIIEADSDFSMDVFVPSIRETITDDGVCYQIFPAYTFNGNFGLRSVFGDGDVTYSMIDELSRQTGTSIRGDEQAAELADQVLRYPLGELVDKQSGNHILSVEELTDIVEYSVNNGMPNGASLNYIADMDTVHYGSYLMCRRFLRNLYELATLETQLDDSFVYLGFPSVYGAAHAADPDGLVAISADTEYQDACWQFIKFMLSDQVQEIEIGRNQNPVVNSVYEEFCARASESEEVPDWVITDYRAMVSSIDSVISYDWGLYVLICDEINSYYLYGKNPEVIAQSLQSRLDIYVQENYG